MDSFTDFQMYRCETRTPQIGNKNKRTKQEKKALSKYQRKRNKKTNDEYMKHYCFGDEEKFAFLFAMPFRLMVLTCYVSQYFPLIISSVMRM